MLYRQGFYVFSPRCSHKESRRREETKHDLFLIPSLPPSFLPFFKKPIQNPKPKTENQNRKENHALENLRFLEEGIEGTGFLLHSWMRMHRDKMARRTSEGEFIVSFSYKKRALIQSKASCALMIGFFAVQDTV